MRFLFVILAALCLCGTANAVEPTPTPYERRLNDYSSPNYRYYKSAPHFNPYPYYRPYPYNPYFMYYHPHFGWIYYGKYPYHPAHPHRVPPHKWPRL